MIEGCANTLAGMRFTILKYIQDNKEDFERWKNDRAALHRAGSAVADVSVSVPSTQSSAGRDKALTAPQANT